ncbi:type I polyketide synthase, partial [Streptomyces milbemycinicus]|uniref:type I polyketide synthase n=1 Tax=Streptomyces milbemycinicus TaxID=476552 RepID=UPI001FE244E2
GHPVLAVVRGSAVNQDGASNGLTAPNGPSQQRVIRQALANARLSAAEVDAVEAHGTGTTLGDPIEAQALLATYGQDRPEGRPLWLGSLKSNIGHTQAASGVAGVIKMVLAMRHGTLPRTLHVDEPSPNVDWSAGAVELLTEQRAWPESGHPRRAGVSSFGVSGTNAHVIIEQAPDEVQQAPDEVEPESAEPGVAPAVVPWVVSGRGVDALREQAARLLSHVESDDELSPVDVAWSLVSGRAEFEHRAVVIGEGRDVLVSGLRALARGETAAGVIGTPASGVGPAGGRPVFVFPGQGSQWAGMAVELLDCAPVFAERFAECGQALAEFVDWDLEAVVRQASGAASLERVDVVQPVSFAVMVSLAELWRSFGVEPVAVVGHSQGEIAAACVAGALSLRDAARVVALRSQAIAEGLAGLGGMMSVGLPLAEVESRLERFGGLVEVAALNGPASVVVAGDPGALDELLAECQAREVRARRVPVDYASHTSHVERIEGKLAGLLAGLEPQPSRIPMYSTVDRGWLGDTLVDAHYWYRNLRQTVHFESAVEALVAQEYGAFVEVSAHPVLTMSIQEALEGEPGPDPVVTGTLRRDEGGLNRFLASLAEAYVQGVPVDWAAAFADTGASRVELPTYAFQRKRYWLDVASISMVAGGFQGRTESLDGSFWAAVERGDVESLATALAVEGTEEQSSLTSLLPALSSWHRQRRTQSTLDAWRYRVIWKPWAAERTSTAALSGRWLLITPAGEADTDWVAAASRALVACGAKVARVEWDTTEHDRVQSAVRLREALANAAAHGEEVSGVLSLLGLDETPHPTHSALSRGLAGTLLLVQALGDAGLDARLWLATQNAVATGRKDEGAISPAQAQLWGLGRVVGLEHPERWGGLVDFPEASAPYAAERLGDVLAGASTHSEDQLAVRAAGVFVRRLVPDPRGDIRPVREWNPHGTVLITGGTGALGRQVARWLAHSGAQHLVLTSRRGAQTPGAAELEKELTGVGVRVTVAACDVADRAALARLLDGLRAEGSPVRSVVHAAGVVESARIDETDVASFADAAEAKVAGAVNLDELLAQDELDAFVLFSSNAGVWGSGAQGAYAAANAHLDALALRRRARGQAATAVAWGAWAGGGMAADPEAEQQLRRRGVLAMEPELAIAALQQTLDHDEANSVVADVDWARFVPGFTAARRRPLLDELPAVQEILRAEDRDVEQVDSDSTPSLARQLAGLTEAERNRTLLDLVRSHAAAVLGHAGHESVGAGQAFKELGFDSLTAVELRNRLQSATGLRLPAALVFDYPTPTDLSDYLRDQLVGSEAASEESALTELDKLEAAISASMALTEREELRSEVTTRLQVLLSKLSEMQGESSDAPDTRDQIASASDDDLFDFINQEFGKS